jgi:hypothetical protein
MRITSAGDVLVNRTASGIGAKLEVQNDTTNAHIATFAVSDTIRPTTIDVRFRAGATAVQSGDILGIHQFRGYDGASTVIAAQISSEVDGTPGLNDMPGRLVFSTTADGANTPTERMRITNAGLVGIGTTSPGKRLDVVGQSRISGTAASGYALMEYGTSATAANNWHVGSEGDGTFRWYNGNFGSGTERMRIDSAGDVGIGTTNPTARLNVVDATSQDAVRITQTGTGNALVVEDSANPDATPFVIDANGRVLVGATTSPPTIETIAPIASLSSTAGSTAAQDFGIYSYQNAGGTGRVRVGSKIFFARSRSGTVGTVGTIVTSGDILGQMRFAGDDGAAFITGAEITAEVDGTPSANDMPGRLVFSTTADGANTPTERMRITSAGDVGIGASPSEALTVSRSTGEAVIGIRNTGTGSSWLTLSPGSSGTAYIHNITNTALALTTNGVERMRITNAGLVGIGTISPAERLHVNSNTSEFAIQWDSTGSNSWVLGSATNRAYIRNKTNNTEVLTILNGGNIGIGRTDPTVKLDVVGTINASNILINGAPISTGNVQTFNSSGTWTKPAGYAAGSRVHIQAWGGGGSGGRNAVSGRGGGGGGGGYIEEWLNLSQLGATETITVGAGGVSRTGSDQAGANGNPTTVGSLVFVGAGAGGPSGVALNGGGGGGQLSSASGANPGNPLVSAGFGYSITNIGSGCIVQYAVTSIDVAYVGNGAATRGSSSNGGREFSGPMDGFWHGGGGGGNSPGANSVFGGAGGGAGTTGTNAGGTSSLGGNGGAGSVTGTAGSQPGGGGGGGTSTSGAGGTGRVIITVFPI